MREQCRTSSFPSSSVVVTWTSTLRTRLMFLTAPALTHPIKGNEQRLLSLRVFHRDWRTWYEWVVIISNKVFPRWLILRDVCWYHYTLSPSRTAISFFDVKCKKPAFQPKQNLLKKKEKSGMWNKNKSGCLFTRQRTLDQMRTHILPSIGTFNHSIKVISRNAPFHRVSSWHGCYQGVPRQTLLPSGDVMWEKGRCCTCNTCVTVKHSYRLTSERVHLGHINKKIVGQVTSRSSRNNEEIVHIRELPVWNESEGAQFEKKRHEMQKKGHLLPQS